MVKVKKLKCFNTNIIRAQKQDKMTLRFGQISKKKRRKKTITSVSRKLVKKIGNNQKCPCKSEKKYKHCCKKNVIFKKKTTIIYMRAPGKMQRRPERACINLQEIMIADALGLNN